MMMIKTLAQLNDLASIDNLVLSISLCESFAIGGDWKFLHAEWWQLSKKQNG